MSNSQITLTISIVMIVLFSIAIFGFSIGFANDNNAAISIADDPDALTVYNNQGSNMSGFKTEVEETSQSILETTVGEGSDVVPSAAPFALTRGSLTSSLKNIGLLPIKVIFGGLGSPFGIFFTTFFSIIILLFILYVIKTWRGNP